MWNSVLAAGVVVLIVLLGIGVVIGIPFLMQWLAKENILFTTVREGTAKAIMRGDSLDHFIMSFRGYHLNDPRKKCYRVEFFDEEGKTQKLHDWEVVYHGKDNKKGFDPEEEDGCYDERSWVLKTLGLYWVGWPWANSVYVYGFEWNETITAPGGGERVLPRSEATDFIYVADFTYAILTEEAETLDRLPVNMLTLVTIAIRNPYRALFSGEDWMRRVTAAINRRIRTFIGDQNFQELVSSKEEHGGTWVELSNSIIELYAKLPDDKKEPPFGLRGRYGAEIRTADLQTIELSGEAKKQAQEATTREYAAKQEAEATRLTGQAEADVIRIKGEEEAKALTSRLQVIKDFGETGITLAGYDAIQESAKGPGNTIIWANNPLPAFVESMKGGKS